MSENADPLENSVAERVNGVLRQEHRSHDTVCSLDEAAQHLARAVFLHHDKRPHLSGARQSPNEAHRRWGPWNGTGTALEKPL